MTSGINEITVALEQLKTALIHNAPKTTVAVRIFISSEETKIDYTLRSPEQLRSTQISMKNIGGDFIK